MLTNWRQNCKKKDFHFASVDDYGLFRIGDVNADLSKLDAIHVEIRRFLIDILKAKKIKNHSYLRDLYCDTSGSESGKHSLNPLKIRC